MQGRFLEVASVFAISLMRNTRMDGRFFLFDTCLEEVAVSRRDSVLTQAERIKAQGGTNTALPMQQLLSERDRVDNIVLFTDEQQNTGTPFFDVLTKYRRTVNADTKMFIVDVSPYRNALTADVPDTWYIYGWSDRVLQS